MDTSTRTVQVRAPIGNDALKLRPAELGEAMARGMALAELVGQAAVVEELHARMREREAQ